MPRLVALTTPREGTRPSAVRDLPARFPTRAAFGETLKRGALLGRRMSTSRSLSLNWPDWFMAVDVGKLRQSLDPTRSAAQVLFGWKGFAGVLTRSASVWRI